MENHILFILKQDMGAEAWVVCLFGFFPNQVSFSEKTFSEEESGRSAFKLFAEFHPNLLFCS